MKLGYINYLNCYPFYYYMFEKEPVEGVEVIPDFPSSLNAMMLRKELDMSPVSAGAYPDMARDVVLLSDFCLSSVGYVGSVNLISKVPIEALENKAVGITSASRTSVVLLKVLLEKFYGITPEYLPAAPLPDMHNLDAALVIGNEAMMSQPEPVSYKYDLGELWMRKTGYPVVFAVFAVQRSALKTYESQIQKVIRSYHDSLNCMKTEKERIVEKAKMLYPNIPYDVNFYYTLLQFDFTKELKEALKYYFDVAGEMGLLEKTGKIEMM